MAKLTLDEMLDDVKAREAITEEAQETTEMIHNATEKLIDAAVSGKVTILSDYDADGICSAYILEHTVKAIAPECDVDVQLNDRRGSYGLSPDLQGEDDRHYIISDMGSNQLPFAREQLGDDVIIIDHHLIEDDAIRNAFVDNTDNNKGLLNPHALHENDEMNAQYCATGLAYRVFKKCLLWHRTNPFNHKLQKSWKTRWQSWLLSVQPRIWLMCWTHTATIVKSSKTDYAESTMQMKRIWIL